MKLNELTDEQLEIIFENNPEWIVIHLPEWVADKYPSWLAYHYKDIMADLRPSYMYDSYNNRDWMIKHRPEWVEKHRDREVPKYIMKLLEETKAC